MKATEIMIGDFFKFSVGKYPYKRGENYQIKTYYDIALHDRLCGIPLTDEILEKNGWYRDSIFMELKADENTQFSWTGRCGAVLYRNGWHHCDCKYVHTLQHALRLCGLNDLADNFKL